MGTQLKRYSITYYIVSDRFLLIVKKNFKIMFKCSAAHTVVFDMKVNTISANLKRRDN